MISLDCENSQGFFAFIEFCMADLACLYVYMLLWCVFRLGMGQVLSRKNVYSRQAVGLANVLHGRRPTAWFAQPDYGLGLESVVRPSPDSSGSPQQREAMAFCTGGWLKYSGGQVISFPFARTTSG
jgi:hypothetical protein